MSAASIFEFRFDSANTAEGFDLASAVGKDMEPTEGYLRHEVVRDIADAGHVAVITFWNEQAQGEAVLAAYLHDAKIERATVLGGGSEPKGFLGLVQ